MTILPLNFKGSSNASFFILCLFSCLSSPVTADAASFRNIPPQKIKMLSASPTWGSLLHISNKNTHIKDPGFLLTKNEFTPEGELRATLNYLYSSNQAVCRFPARYLWLKKQLNLPPLNIEKCGELIEFEQKAPIESIYLIFASENISQPSSMMGHLLIKISGIVGEERKDHAISFYTSIDGINLPKIIYQSLISGKKGYFSLSPYSEKLFRYNNIENRNIWEYKLELDSYQKKLLQYHFYELKQTQLTYFFDDYNCATLIQFMLSITSNKFFSQTLFGTTPIDVIKQAQQHNMVLTSELIPSPKWKLRMLDENIKNNTRKKIKISVKNKKTSYLQTITDKKEQFLAYEIMESYVQLKSTEFDEKFKDNLITEKNNIEDFNIDLKNYKSPLKSPLDSQISIGASKFIDENFLFITLLPASHKLEDNNNQYFGETELTLGSITLAASTESDEFFIDSINVYGVKSLMPHNYFSGGLSGSFNIGTEQQLNKKWETHTKGFIDGAIGKTYSLGSDIKIYGLLGSGISVTRQDFFPELTPEVGIVVNEVFNMKSLIQYQHYEFDSKFIPDHEKVSFTQSFHLNNEWGFFVKVETWKFNNRDEDKYSFWLKHYF